MNLNLPKQIIHTLLYEGGSTKKSDLAKFLNISVKEVNDQLPEVKNLLSILELNLIHNDTSLEIGLSTEINNLINKTKIEELKTPLSESALQTLSVIIYKNKATKAEIDFIRGVDSVRSIKSLLSRGLVEIVQEKNRKNYIPTTETLMYLNVSSVVDLPDQKEVSTKLKALIEGE